jgi:DNA-binding MarR family transcriptional regulator
MAAVMNPVREADSPLLLGPLEQVLGYHVAQAAVATVSTFHKHIGAPLKLRKVEYSLLMLLHANGPLVPKRLAQELKLSAPALTQLLDTLQQRDLLRRERNEADRRSQFIVLTAAGTALAQRGAEVVPAMEQELLDRLSPAEHAMLIELLKKVGGRGAA